MNARKDIEPVTTLKKDAAELIARAKRRGSTIVITQNGKATAVLQDVDSYERQRQALILLRCLAQGERAYQAGHTLTNEKARKRFARELDELADNE